jgi:hypothetical protein
VSGAEQPIDWQAHVDALTEVRALLEQWDADKLFSYLPAPAGATEDELLAVEAHLGEPLDPQYRAFLAIANGWPGFIQSNDLFGTEDLLGGPRMQLAREFVGYLEREPVPGDTVHAADFVPIGASQFEDDVFLLARHHTAQPGKVSWYAGDHFETHDTFEAFFLSLVAVGREVIEHPYAQPSNESPPNHASNSE